MWKMTRPIAIITVILLVPLIPFLLLGDPFEEAVRDWFAQPHSTTTRFSMIVLALSADLFLPIPSSVVSTYGGGILGTIPATIASWIGMSLGAIIGFAIAKTGGTPLAKKFANPNDLENLEAITKKHYFKTILLTRPLPLLAEATVLLLGTMQLRWSQFLPPILMSNLIISFIYAAFGQFFAQYNALYAAIIISALLPLIIALITRKRLK